MLWTSLTHDGPCAVFGNTGHNCALKSQHEPRGVSSDDFQQISLPRSEAGSELRDGWLTYWPWQVPRGTEECAGTFWNFQRSCFQPHVKVMLCSEPVRRTACSVCLHDSITNKPHHISPVSSSFAILTLFPFVRHAKGSQNQPSTAPVTPAAHRTSDVCVYQHKNRRDLKVVMMEWQFEW